jgi:hypothetical protein
VKIYLAGSARNAENFHLVKRRLEDAGHEVHDWTTGPAAYTWEEVGVADTDHCSVEEMQAASKEIPLLAGLEADYDALEDASAFVLLLPAGADAHMEFGLVADFQIPLYILTLTGHLRASQFYAIADGIFGNVEELLEALNA